MSDFFVCSCFRCGAFSWQGKFCSHLYGQMVRKTIMHSRTLFGSNRERGAFYNRLYFRVADS